MGKFSIHVKHYKSPQLSGIDRHNRRLSEKHSNSRIDTAKSSDNIAIVPVRESLYKDTKARLEKEVLSKGNRITKASVWISEVCCTLPFGIEAERSESYFREIVRYFEETQGKENVMSAYIHFDETTPHLHLCLTNVTPDGKLSRKELWTRQRLFEIHEKLPQLLQQKGYDVERGDHLADFENKKKSKLSLNQYKIFREKEKIKEQYKDLIKDYNQLVDKYNESYRDCVELQQSNLQTAQHILDNYLSRSR